MDLQSKYARVLNARLDCVMVVDGVNLKNKVEQSLTCYYDIYGLWGDGE